MPYERLTSIDTAFLHLERFAVPLHVGALAVFEGGPFFGPDGRFRLHDVRRRIAARLHLAPRLRKRAMAVPLDQGRPVWVDDETFDVSAHVRLVSLPPPGGDDELKALTARLQAVPLDRRRPLWELWFVEGLEGGRVGVVQKIHHALVDGASAVELATLLLDRSAHPPEPEAPPWRPEPAPPPWRLLADTLAERPARGVGTLESLAAAVANAGAVVDAASDAAEALGVLGRLAPPTSLNVPVGPHRRFEVVRAARRDLKAAARAAGATRNDVVLAAVAGGLRHLFEARGERVADLVLRVLVPVAGRRGAHRGRGRLGVAEPAHLGNRASAMVADLPVGIADPAERLGAVSALMREAKGSRQAAGGEVLLSLADHLPLALLDAVGRLLPRQRVVNLAVTTVAGPPYPLYLMGARLLEVFPYAGVFDGLSLTVAVVSHAGGLGLGLTGDHDAVPDLHVLAEGIERSLPPSSAAQRRT